MTMRCINCKHQQHKTYTSMYEAITYDHKCTKYNFSLNSYEAKNCVCKNWESSNSEEEKIKREIGFKKID